MWAGMNSPEVMPWFAIPITLFIGIFIGLVCGVLARNEVAYQLGRFAGRQESENRLWKIQLAALSKSINPSDQHEPIKNSPEGQR